ncbi:helix-turn-helix transcriptional regulator [Piscinibacter sp.]|jgi:DNA-binding CsgD family transcriptional regulator|uniref:helix-turn-helix transcriptional regulator n=1 Tax=Piscinibacter sp. TaxID=1903157 RepID=UPI001B568805|nr:helix-turn-helix transcriptional regulator [Piscinibacter sp.]MBK7530524.1 helix-turn-helix transcriptional regulator [Piscinibacter sp.]MBP6544389.1 helix-turn-helix transcriptional regulator [Piscinibacter sp.]
MNRPADAADAAALARVVDRLGDEGFGPALLAWLAPTLRIAHVTAFRFDATLQVRVVMTASTDGSAIATQSARVYGGSGLYRHDRLLDTMRQRASAGDEAPAIVRLRRADIADAAYGEQLWDRFGLVDRLSALALLDGHWTALNVYRDASVGAFAARDAQRFAGRCALLLALLRRHLAALRPAAAGGTVPRVAPETAAALLGQLPVRLSPREREVCALTLAGHSREGVGLALGIAASSVATLRERAYRKLQIHSAGELFALCLQHARPASERGEL